MKTKRCSREEFYFLFCPALSDLLCCQSLSYTSNHLANFLGFGSVVQASRAEHHGKWCVKRPLQSCWRWRGFSCCFPLTFLPSKLDRRRSKQYHIPLCWALCWLGVPHCRKEHVAGGMRKRPKLERA